MCYFCKIHIVLFRLFIYKAGTNQMTRKVVFIYYLINCLPFGFCNGGAEIFFGEHHPKVSLCFLCHGFVLVLVKDFKSFFGYIPIPLNFNSSS
mgnify:CR=1 FL=1